MAGTDLTRKGVWRRFTALLSSLMEASIHLTVTPTIQDADIAWDKAAVTGKTRLSSKHNNLTREVRHKTICFKPEHLHPSKTAALNCTGRNGALTRREAWLPSSSLQTGRHREKQPLPILSFMFSLCNPGHHFPDSRALQGTQNVRGRKSGLKWQSSCKLST